MYNTLFTVNSPHTGLGVYGQFQRYGFVIFRECIYYQCIEAFVYILPNP